MTLDLQIILAAIGVVIVLVVYLISRWQNRMSAPSRKSAGGGRDSGKDAPVLDPLDALDDELDADLPGVSRARMFDPPAGAAGGYAVGEQDPAARGPDPEPPAADTRGAKFRSRRIEGFEQLSQIDYWVKITGERDVGRETVLALYRDAAVELRKSHGIYGLKMPEKVWRNLENEAEDSRFADLVLTIQLADRNGAIDEAEMTRFSALVTRLSEGTGREFVFMTTVENAFAQARAIADFAAHYDSIFVVNVRPREDGQFQGAAIERCALGMGLERDDNCYYSRFKSANKSKVTLYSLADHSETGRFDYDNMASFRTRGLVFFTRPAVNRSPGAVYAEMVDAAKAFAARVKGDVDSPEYDDLSQDNVDVVRSSIEQMAAEMEQAGIAAGSDEAVRIF